MRIFFFFNILPPYRIGLYNKLNKKLKGEVKFFFDSYSERNRRWNSFNNNIEFNYEILNSLGIVFRSKTSSNTTLLRTVYFPFRILKICFTDKPDIIVSLEMGLRTLLCILYSKVFHKKVFLLSEVTLHSEGRVSWFKTLFRKFICKNINGGIAHGILSLEYLKTLGLSSSKVIISPDAVENEFFIRETKKCHKAKIREELNISETAFVFLFVGQFIHLKGIDLLINAIQELIKVHKEIKINTVLAGGDKEDLRNLVSNFDESIFKFVGFKQKEELVKLYVLSDCLVFPSRQDVWGMVVNEAIACDLPVVVSKYAGCSADLIEDGVNGYIFNPLSDNDFIEVLEKCINDREKLNTFVKRAKEKLKIYNHVIAADKIINFIT